MSRFFSGRYSSLTPYTPGEQPQNRRYIKLNTNESPFPPSAKAMQRAAEEAEKLQLYSDPEAKILTKSLAEYYDVSEREVLPVNGSDEALNFAFMAFCDETKPAAFADITYGFYPVFAQLNRIPFQIIPLKDDFSIDITDYFDLGKTIFIANPNAPTGIALPAADIEEILRHNRGSVVVVDEAYVDFGAESCVPLIHKYDNLLVVQTFSKSRSMAGARLGFAIGCEELIRDLNTIKYSTNPYNVNRMTMAAGAAALEDDAYTKSNCQTIIETRSWFKTELEKLGFTCLDSRTNFLFAKHRSVGGKLLYEQLKDRGILVRHFEADRIRDFNRITIGTMDDMKTLVRTLKEIV